MKPTATKFTRGRKRILELAEQLREAEDEVEFDPVVYDRIKTLEKQLENERSWFEHNFDLVEIVPFADFKIDEPVMVRTGSDTEWQKRHFAGISPEGKPQVWGGGSTSWTAGENAPSAWGQCRRPTKEEKSRHEQQAQAM